MHTIESYWNLFLGNHYGIHNMDNDILREGQILSEKEDSFYDTSAYYGWRDEICIAYVLLNYTKDL